MNFRYFTAFSCAAGFAVLPVSAATYHVSQQPAAADDGPGSAEHPWKTIAKAAQSVQPGDRVFIHAGVYRETAVCKTSGASNAPIRFEAAPGESVVMSGADVLGDWQRSEASKPVFAAAWPHRFNGHTKSMTHPDDEYHQIVGRCEQVMIDGFLLRQVLHAEQLAPGAFYADVERQTLLAWDIGNRDLNKVFVEASTRPLILRVEGEFVQVCGIRFRYAANAAQHGAVEWAGRHGLLEDCVLEWMNASGASFTAEDIVVRRCVFRENGQLGFGAAGAHRFLFTDSLVEHNNVKDFDRGWEAGGDKLVLSRGAVLEHSRFLRNHGTGVWFDIGNTNCEVRNCLIADNDDAGIFYEISYGLRAHDNVIVGNGFAQTAGAWGAQSGITLSSSPGAVIERNILFGNREGFNFREQDRTTPVIGDSQERAVWNHDQTIRHNVIARNRDAQVWGWFDTKEMQWPAGSRDSGSAASGVKPGDLAGAYVARDLKSRPEGLTLEKLNIRFENNIYFAAPGQGMIGWGTTWSRHKRYATLAEFATDLKIDAGGKILEPAFTGPSRLDFRLPRGVMKNFEGNYPQGTVPGTLLGEE